MKKFCIIFIVISLLSCVLDNAKDNVNYVNVRDDVNKNKIKQRYIVDGYTIEIIDDGNAAMIVQHSSTKTEIQIPSQIQGLPITVIGYRSFQSNALRSVIIPDSVTYIEYAAFLGNPLTNITIPKSVSSIGGFAFYDNLLTSITIGENVILEGGFWDPKYAGDYVFTREFDEYYYNNGCKAGTYTYSNGRWSLQ